MEEHVSLLKSVYITREDFEEFGFGEMPQVLVIAPGLGETSAHGALSKADRRGVERDCEGGSSKVTCEGISLRSGLFGNETYEAERSGRTNARTKRDDGPDGSRCTNNDFKQQQQQQQQQQRSTRVSGPGSARRLYFLGATGTSAPAGAW